MANDRERQQQHDQTSNNPGFERRQARDEENTLSRRESDRITEAVNRELWDGPHFERSGGQRGRDQERSSGLDS